MSVTSVGYLLSGKWLGLLLWLAIAPARAESLHYLGRQILPQGYEFAGTIVGGLSGLDCVPDSNQCLVISDDRSERHAARFYSLELDPGAFNTYETPGFDGIKILAVTSLTSASGATHAEGTVDPEAIRIAKGGGFWWVSEGNVKRGIPPVVEKISSSGKEQSRLKLPPHFMPGPERGVRDNLAFESLAFLGEKLVVGTENALVQDGPVADLEQPSPTRLLVFDTSSGRHLAEYVYMVEAVDQAPPLPGLYRTNGLVELLGDNGTLLALERRYTMGVGNGARIYRVSLDDATDVSDRASLSESQFIPVKKTLLLNLKILGIELDNLEGMSWGPRMPNGQRTIILVSDNNFSGRQVTQFLAFVVVD